MRLISAFALTLFITACTSNRTSELEKENEQLRLQNENTVLRNQSEALEHEEREQREALKHEAIEQRDNALMEEFLIWKEREKSKTEKMIVRNGLLDKYNHKKISKAKNDKEKRKYEMFDVMTKISLSSHKKQLSELEGNEYYTFWYNQRSEGRDAKIITDSEYEWLDKPINH